MNEHRAQALYAVFCTFGFAIFILLCGCGMTPLDRAIVSANAAAEVGEQGALVLRDTCTTPYAAASTAERIAELDSWCLPAAQALTVYRTAWIALVGGVAAARDQGLDTAALLVLTARLTAASQGIARAFAVPPPPLGGAQ